MIVAVLQARFTSTRLPGKVLKPILGKPMLALQIERIQKAKLIDQLILATSQENDDNAIEQLAKTVGVVCHRGSLEDVLDRFYGAVSALKPEYVVRLTGDCPLADPHLIDRVIQFCVDGKFDYVSNALEPTFPDGLDVEVMTFKALEMAWKEATLKSEREHVTPFIHKRPERFKIGIFKNQEDLSALRWTVDEPEDFQFVKSVYESLYPKNSSFQMSDVLQWMKSHPEMARVNAKYQRNEGYAKSIARDAARG